MRSISDNFREDDRRAQAEMTAAERVELALELGDQDLEIFRQAHGLTTKEARHELRRRRQLGRTPCTFFEVEP
jgi:hypothetical protein